MADGQVLQRSYTPISSDSLLGTFQLLIKTYEKGNISKYMDELSIGDTVEMSGPKGRFTYEPNKYQHIAMIAGGSGITPMFQVKIP